MRHPQRGVSSVIDAGVVSYLSAAVLFAVLTVLLTVGRSGKGLGTSPILASALSALWAIYLAIAPRYPFAAEGHALWYGIEVARYGGWLAFMARLLYAGPGPLGIGPRGWLVHGTWLAVLVAGLTAEALWPGEVFGTASHVALVQLGGLLLLALIGLLLVEQLARNTRAEARGSLKHLYLSLFTLFALDLVVFAVGFMSRMPDQGLWDLRGVANALIVPLLALSATRNPDWSPRAFVSRHVAFYATSLLVAGGFLILVAVGGYYVRLYGGTWGGFLQLTLLSAAVLLLAVLALSAAQRARLRVFLVKHFYRSRYDYREEWLRLMGRLGKGTSPAAARRSLIAAIGGIVQSPGGLLFERSGSRFRCAAAQGIDWVDAEASADDPFARRMAERGWIFDLEESAPTWTAEPDLPRPDWLSPIPEAWLIIPLRTEAGLVGWVVLLRSEIVKTLTWEDRDLLKASGRAAAVHLALIQATEALSEAQQFDAFNRLSAFVVHDINNVVAQLSLIVSNAHVHDGNPDFVKDAVATIEHAVGRMNRLLTQLHKVPVSPGAKARIELDHAVSAAVERCRGGRPAPELRLEAQGLGIIIDAERLQSVVENLVKNAQEATPDDDRVTVSVARRGERALLVIDDTGCGMDAAFVRERLFKPFDTTKGNSGMGIGAHEARELVRGAGGDLKVSSSPGQGTRIELWFPLAHPANPRSAEAPLRQSGG